MSQLNKYLKTLNMPTKNANFEDPACGPEEMEFLAKIRKNSYLEREKALHMMNFELEKKSTDLMEQIDNFSRKSSTEELIFQNCELSQFDFESSPENIDETKEMIMQTSQSSESSTSLVLLRSRSSKNIRSSQSSHSTLSSSTLAASSSGLSSSTSSQISLRMPGQVVPSSQFSRNQSQFNRATDSVVKCLQSKLVNHEERLSDLHVQYREKIQENVILEAKIKSLEEDRDRLFRNISTLQSALDKQLKQAESSKNNLNNKAQQLMITKKEAEDFKKDLKQSQALIQSLQTRLNRALEENDKLKHQNKSLNLQVKEIQADQRLKFEEKFQTTEYKSSTKIGNPLKMKVI